MQRGYRVLQRQVRQCLVLGHLQDDRRRTHLEEGRHLAHVRVADDAMQPPVLLRVGMRFVARVDDRALERGLETHLGLEEVRTL